MTPDEVRGEIGTIHAAISGVASRHPELVMLAVVDELISVACGTNPALRDTMRLQLYRRIRDRVMRIEYGKHWDGSESDGADRPQLK